MGNGLLVQRDDTCLARRESGFDSLAVHSLSAYAAERRLFLLLGLSGATEKLNSQSSDLGLDRAIITAVDRSPIWGVRPIGVGPLFKAAIPQRLWLGQPCQRWVWGFESPTPHS